MKQPAAAEALARADAALLGRASRRPTVSSFTTPRRSARRSQAVRLLVAASIAGVRLADNIAYDP